MNVPIALLAKQALIRGSLIAAGDFVVQRRMRGSVEPWRMFGYFSFGVCSAPVIYGAFGSLPGLITRYLGGSRFVHVKTAAVFEIGVWPTIVLPILFATTKTAQGSSPSEIAHIFADEGPELALWNIITWTPVSFLQSKYVPTHHTVVFRSFVCTASAIFLSYMMNERVPEDEAQEGQPSE